MNNWQMTITIIIPIVFSVGATIYATYKTIRFSNDSMNKTIKSVSESTNKAIESMNFSTAQLISVKTNCINEQGIANIKAGSETIAKEMADTGKGIMEAIKTDGKETRQAIKANGEESRKTIIALLNK
jgi:hypothetical protein